MEPSLAVFFPGGTVTFISHHFVPIAPQSVLLSLLIWLIAVTTVDWPDRGPLASFLLGPCWSLKFLSAIGSHIYHPPTFPKLKKSDVSLCRQADLGPGRVVLSRRERGSQEWHSGEEMWGLLPWKPKVCPLTHPADIYWAATVCQEIQPWTRLPALWVQTFWK